MTDMNSLDQDLERDNNFWLEHVKAAQNFIGTDVEYCRRNGINEKTFSSRKKKFGFTKPIKKKTARKFIEIERKEHRPVASGAASALRSNANTKVDAKWMAEFVATLMNLQK